MLNIKRLTALILIASLSGLSACSKDNASSSAVSKDKNLITVDNGEDAPTIDPVMAQDSTSARVLYDLFEGLTSFDQSNHSIPGLAEKWDVSADGKVYTFHLRDGLKFSDGSPITATDVVFSWQRLADPKIASPYINLAANIVNGNAIRAGKAPLDQLGVKALDAKTVQITLIHPDAAFLQICAMPNTATVSKANVAKYGQTWADPKTMVTSGAYTVGEWVIKGHMLLNKNPNYYDAKNVSVKQVNILPIVDYNAAFNRYKTGEIDISFSLPIDQYKSIRQDYPTQEHTVTMEALYYYDLNMTLPKFRDNIKLRQALSMAVDRDTLVKDVLGQDQVPSYSYVTSTIENGKFANNRYPWGSWSRANQVDEAKKLFKEAGYGPSHPLEISISYNTMDSHKKIAMAIASMWQQVFGADSIKTTAANQEWKSFIQARNTANYDVARDGWVADYDSVDAYTNLFLCKDPLNKSKYCNPSYDQLIQQAQNTPDPDTRAKLIKQALQIAQDAYVIIPLYQYTYYRLVSPRVSGYNMDNNHFDHVMSKWYKLN
ncbi:MAG: peptide ABC transporter substrate-binding protein [Neisseriales bacterium]|nr:MAG: peptide ABC transporter substrate-binding protein [Neisseriales bacterium]